MSLICYAKPNQTYHEHLEAVYMAWKETIEAKRFLIKRLAKKYKFSVSRFLQGSLLTVVVHDVGKMTEPFQAMMKAIREDKKFDRRKNYRHELASFVFSAAAWNALNRSEHLSKVPIEALSVVGHHKTLNTDLTSFEREGNLGAPHFIPAGLKEALEIAQEFFRREGWMFPQLPDGLEDKNPYSSLADLIGWDGVFFKLLNQEESDRVRVLYILIKGILHYADWHGSGKDKVCYRIETSPQILEEKLKLRCQEKEIVFEGWRPVQKPVGIHSGHLVLIAPTGSGKTEASLLWAIRNLKEMGGAKIIYLLPTMVTANSTWQRFCEFFGKENVGLTHSTANLLLEKNGEENEADIWENRRDVLFSQAFIRPITVGTVGLLLTAGFNAGRWVLKEINSANAVIILDEIHAYDGWTLGLIISSIRHFAGLGARFLLISATLPSSLLRLFKQELKAVDVIRDDTLLSAKRSRYFVDDRQVEEAS